MKNYSAFSSGNGYGWTGVRSKKLQEVIRESSATIAELKKKLKFHAIAFSGSSGGCVAFHAAIEHNIPLIYVRKPEEKSHGHHVESNFTGNIKKYLIVDDFICSGDTVKRILKDVQQYAYTRGAYIPECVGVFCFVEFPCVVYDREFLINGNNVQLKSYTRNNFIGDYDE